MTDIPPSHPRYASLVARERLVHGMREGLTSKAGLIAHGRGEALDYLIGERTTEEAREAARAAAALLLMARRPVVSVNGNVAALAAEGVVELQRTVTGIRARRGHPEPRLWVEVNLFHRTEERVARIATLLRELGAEEVLGEVPEARVPGLEHARALCSSQGVGSADVVLIPLEDGDRAEALRDWGRRVVAIDLNPLSRTSRAAHVTVVDELSRALEAIRSAAEAMADETEETLTSLEAQWDNGRALRRTLERICRRLMDLDPLDVGEGQ